MNPIIIDLGIIQIRAFTFWWLFGGALAAGIVLWCVRRAGLPPLKAADCLLLATPVALFGGRLEHVITYWEYFALHPQEVARLDLGGLGAYGALCFGVAGVLMACQWRQLPSSSLLAGLALALPVLAFWGSVACASTGCGYGWEVPTLAGWLPGLVAELPNAFGDIAPRLNLVSFALAMAAAGGLLGLSLWYWARPYTFGGVLAFGGLCGGMLSMGRGDEMPRWFGPPMDFALALVIFWLGVGLLFRARRIGRDRQTPAE
jgi:prolipoprotein diacylglyceryltransferase